MTRRKGSEKEHGRQRRISRGEKWGKIFGFKVSLKEDLIPLSYGRTIEVCRMFVDDC